MESTSPLEAAVERQHYNVTLAALTVAGIAYALLQTMVVPALPALQRDFHTSTTRVTWLLTSFLLVSAVATPILGKLGDQYGKAKLLRISLGVLLAGCIAAVFAWDIWSLIAARAIQGLGGAVFPLSFAIIKDEFPDEKVGTAVGVVSAVFGIGGGLGLVVSGFVLDNLSWRWMFVVSALAVASAAALVWRFVPESQIKTTSRLDVPGAVLLSLGLGSLLFGISEASGWGWNSGRVLGLFATACIALLACAFVELRLPEPMLDMRMLAHRPVLLTNLTGLLGGFAMFGSYVLVPNFVETPRGLSREVASLVDYGFHASSTTVGLYLLPGTLIGLVSGPLVGTMGRRWGSKWPLACGVALAAVGSGELAEWHDHPWQIVLGMFMLGAGFPFMFGAMAKLIVDSVRPEETGVAGGMNTVVRTVGGVVGAQVVAAILASNSIAGTHVPKEAAFVSGFWIAAAAGAVSVGVALAITPRRRLLRRRADYPSIEGIT